MRIISGTHRSRKIVPPTGELTRPITDRAKESIFNIMTNLIDFEGVTVFDLYAGSGSFGLECLSRGAGHVDFVEQSKAGVQALETNTSTLGFENFKIHRSQVQKFIETPNNKCDIAFCDPPYVDDPWTKIFDSINAKYLVGHSERDFIMPDDGWEELTSRKYGRSKIIILKKY